jgi:hypothetical protein
MTDTVMQKLVRQIVVLQQQHSIVVVQLATTVREEDPELAGRWLGMHRLDYIDRAGKEPPNLFPFELWGRAAEMLTQHPRYGYAAEWAWRWWEQADALKSEAIAQLGGDSKKLWALLNAEMTRRRGN